MIKYAWTTPYVICSCKELAGGGLSIRPVSVSSYEHRFSNAMMTHALTGSPVLLIRNGYWAQRLVDGETFPTHEYNADGVLTKTISGGVGKVPVSDG
jgi:hypothetical protein